MLKLMPLPYAYDALEPVLSRDSVRQHYEGNHAGYVRKLNELLHTDPNGPNLQQQDLAHILARTKIGTPIHNMAAQNWIHNFYWRSMCSIGQGGSPLSLGSEIETMAFEELFVQAGVSHFGNGWVWLVRTMSKHVPFAIRVTSDAGMPHFQELPLLVCDVWEHAYICDWGNTGREKYIRNWFNIVNWNAVQARLRGELRNT